MSDTGNEVSSERDSASVMHRFRLYLIGDYKSTTIFALPVNLHSVVFPMH